MEFQRQLLTPKEVEALLYIRNVVTFSPKASTMREQYSSTRIGGACPGSFCTILRGFPFVQKLFQHYDPETYLLLFNYYSGSHVLPYHQDNALSTRVWSQCGVVGLQGTGRLGFKYLDVENSPTVRPYYDDNPDISFLIGPGDVVTWSYEEEAGGLHHGGRFDIHRTSLAFRTIA